MTEKKPSLLQLLTATLFVGLLLSFALFYLIHTFFGHDSKEAPTCTDGSVIAGEDFLAKFDRAVYQNADTQTKIREQQFLLFGAVSHPNVVAGDNNFLFEIENADARYNYLEDYLGLSGFSQTEHAAILSLLERRTASYAARGAEYLLVVLPNSQTVYSENMPSYVGQIGDTRLKRLTEYLAAHGFENYLDLTQSLTSYKSEGTLYNNTENSLNSLGIYYTYLSVCRYIQQNLVTPTYVIPRDSFSFYRHLTTGKTVARSAGLENVVQNLTVSLSNNTKLNYETTLAQGRVTQTKLPGEDLPLGISATPTILLQFSNQWERLQAEPYFSNSFTKVTYQTNWVDDPAIFELASPSVVVQFVYEYQLSWLLPLTLPS